MEAIRKRLEQDLKAAMARLRQHGGGAALEDLMGPKGEHWAFADEVDEILQTDEEEGAALELQSDGPSVQVSGPGGTELLGTEPSAEEIRAAVEKVSG